MGAIHAPALAAHIAVLATSPEDLISTRGHSQGSGTPEGHGAKGVTVASTMPIETLS